METHHLTQSFSSTQLKDEMTDTRLPDFVSYADKIYHDA